MSLFNPVLSTRKPSALAAYPMAGQGLPRAEAHAYGFARMTPTALPCRPACGPAGAWRGAMTWPLPGPGADGWAMPAMPA